MTDEQMLIRLPRLSAVAQRREVVGRGPRKRSQRKESA